MHKLQGKKVYLAALKRADCRKLWEDDEYDFENKTDMLHIGGSVEGSDKWFDEIQDLQGKVHIRLGIFVSDGTVIGDVALQDIDNKNRSCSIGIGIAKIENRGKGYGSEALRFILEYGFNNAGMERITASTLELNLPMRAVFEKTGFTLEGVGRKAAYFGGKKYDMYYYGLLSDEYNNSDMNRKKFEKE